MLHPYFIDSSLGRCLSGKVKWPTDNIFQAPSKRWINKIGV
jgi:hypothetical protein